MISVLVDIERFRSTRQQTSLYPLVLFLHNQGVQVMDCGVYSKSVFVMTVIPGTTFDEIMKYVTETFIPALYQMGKLKPEEKLRPYGNGCGYVKVAPC